MTMEKKTEYSSCDTCQFLEYDEDDEAYYCSMDVDEDDYQRLAANGFKACPYYRDGDDYKVVRHQM